MPRPSKLKESLGVDLCIIVLVASHRYNTDVTYIVMGQDEAVINPCHCQSGIFMDEKLKNNGLRSLVGCESSSRGFTSS